VQPGALCTAAPGGGPSGLAKCPVPVARQIVLQVAVRDIGQLTYIEPRPTSLKVEYTRLLSDQGSSLAVIATKTGIPKNSLHCYLSRPASPDYPGHPR
jgi:hypothetical protein